MHAVPAEPKCRITQRRRLATRRQRPIVLAGQGLSGAYGIHPAFAFLGIGVDGAKGDEPGAM